MEYKIGSTVRVKPSAVVHPGELAVVVDKLYSLRDRRYLYYLSFDDIDEAVHHKAFYAEDLEQEDTETFSAEICVDAENDTVWVDAVAYDQYGIEKQRESGFGKLRGSGFNDFVQALSFAAYSIHKRLNLDKDEESGADDDL